MRSALASRVSLLILHTQAKYGAYSRDSSRFPRQRSFISLNRHTPRNSGGILYVSTRFGLRMEMSRLTRDGTAEPVSRDQILRHARGQGNTIFPVQLTTSRIGNLTRLIYTLLYVMTIHTYIHTPSSGQSRVYRVTLLHTNGVHC